MEFSIDTYIIMLDLSVHKWAWQTLFCWSYHRPVVPRGRNGIRTDRGETATQVDRSPAFWRGHLEDVLGRGLFGRRPYVVEARVRKGGRFGGGRAERGEEGGMEDRRDRIM